MKRQLVRGFMDGALSILGVVIGASGGNIEVILSAGLGGGVANGISNMFSGFSAEKIEEEEKIRKLEKLILSDLRDTVIMKEIRRKIFIGGILVSLFTISGSLLPALLFILAYFTRNSVWAALIFSVFLTASALGIVGFIREELQRNTFSFLF